MARDTGPQCKQCRREGMKLFLKGERCYSEKCSYTRRPYPPGQHGQARIKLSEYRALENRFKMLDKSHPEQAKVLLAQAQDEVNLRWKLYQHLAARDLKAGGQGTAPKTPATVEN